MSEAHATHTPRPDATISEGELDVLACIYKRAIEAYEVERGAHPGAPDDGIKSKEDSANASIIQK